MRHKGLLSLATVVVAAFVTSTSGNTIPVGDDLGCLPVSGSNREFTVPPMYYNPTQNTPFECRRLCNSDDFEFSGVTEGWGCLCTHLQPTGTAVDTATYCTTPCTGDLATHCGGLSYIHAFATPIAIRNFVILDAGQGTYATYMLSSVELNQTSGPSSMTYTMYGQDGSLPVQSSSQNIAHRYRIPGAKEIMAKVEDAEGNFQVDYQYIDVKTNVSDNVNISCPDAWPVNTDFFCEVTIDWGTDMSATVTFDSPSNPNLDFEPPDGGDYTVGISSGTDNSVTAPANQIHLLMNDVLKHDGTLAGFEYFVRTAGTAELLIFRPKCAANEVFCFRSYTCIADTANCRTQTYRWKKSCDTGSGFYYSFSKKTCINPTTGVEQEDLFATTWTSMPVKSYDMVYRKVVTPSSTGQMYEYTVGENIKIKKGDLVGVRDSTGSVLAQEAVTGNWNELRAPNNGHYPADWTIGNFYSFPGGHGVSKHLGRHMVKAHVVRPSYLKFRQKYNAKGVYNIDLGVWNEISGIKKDNHSIDIQEIVTNVTMQCPYAVATNDVVIFDVGDHTGNKVTYNWTFNDGEYNSTQFKPQSHIFTDAGVYFVELTIFNKISSESTNCTVIIQDRIQNLTLTPHAIATIFKQPALVDVNIDQGTNVTYFLHPGDGTVYNTSWEGEFLDWVTPDANKGINYASTTGYIYSNIGNFTYYVNASNLISDASYTIYLPVQIVIENVTIIQPPPIAHGEFSIIYMKMDAGSHVEFSANFGGIPARNFSMSDVTKRGYLILEPIDFTGIGPFELTLNASNLVGPLVRDSVSVWVDYRLTNVVTTPGLLYVTPGTEVTFNVTMSQGSRYVVYFDWDDGTSTQDYQNLTLAGTTLQYSHIFFLTHNHTVNITFVSPIDTQSFQHVITVQDPVQHLDMKCSSPNKIPYLSTALVKCEIFQKFTHKISCVETQTTNVTNVTSVTVNFDCFSGNATISGVAACSNVSCDTSCTGLTPNTSCYSVNGTLSGVADCPNVSCNTSCTSLTPNTSCQAITRLPTPTDPFYEYTWNDGTKEYNYMNATTMVEKLHYDTHVYSRYNTYNISVNVSNFVSHQILQYSVDVDEEIKSPQVTANPRIVRVDEPTTLTATLIWGSRFTMNWTWQDGNSNIKPYSYRNDTMSHNHIYTTPGHYKVMVSAINVFHPFPGVTYQMPESDKVIVQYPPKKMKLWCTPSALLVATSSPPFTEKTTCNILVEKGVNPPSEAFYEVDFDNNLKKGATNLLITNDNAQDTTTHAFVHNFMHNIGFTSGGTYHVKVRVWNLVDEINITAQVDIYEDIYQLSKVPFINQGSGNTTTMVPGVGYESSYFPLEQPVAFTTDMLRGSHITYNWNFGEGIPSTFKTTANKDILHTFAAPGDYLVTLDASNLLSQVHLERIVRVQRSIKNIDINAKHNPHPKNRTFEFTIDAGTMGTDACYFIDFQDPKSTTPIVYFAGNQSQCIESFPVDWARSGIRRFEPKSNADFDTYGPLWIVTNHYMTKGQYTLKLQAANQVSKAEFEYDLLVTKGPCSKPIVNIAKYAPNLCDPSGVDCIGGKKAYYKAKTVQILASVRTNCEATNVHHYNWTLEKLNENTNAYEEFDVSYMADVEMYRRCIYPEKHVSILFKPRKLPYGNYKLCLAVDMDGEKGIFTIDCLEFIIRKSDLKGQIYGGSNSRIPWNFNITLDGISETVDPDCDYDNPDENCYEGWSFEWYCRRKCDSWGTFLEPDYKNYTFASAGTACTDYVALKRDKDKGCFWDDLQDGPAQIQNVDGVSTVSDVDLENGKIIINTFYMYELDSHVIMMVARRDTRTLVAYQTVFITKGAPPKASIFCLNNCLLLNPNGIFSLMSKVENAARILHLYNWNLYEVVQGEEEGDEQYILMDQQDLARNSDTGTEIDNFVSKENYFSDIKFSPGKKYLIRVRVIRFGSDPNNYAEPDRSFRVNTVPKRGTCEIFPKNGIAANTSFHIECSTPFEPNYATNPAIYELFTRTNEQADWQSKESFTASDIYTKTFQLANGEKENGYVLYLKLKCTDQVGSFSETFFTAVVDPPPPSKLAGVLSALTEGSFLTASSSSGSSSSSDAADSSSSLLQQTIESGDMSAATMILDMVFDALQQDTTTTPAQAVSTTTPIPTQPPDTSNISPEELEKQRIEKLKKEREEAKKKKKAEQAQTQKFIEFATSIPVKSPTDLIQMTSRLDTLTAVSENVNADACDDMNNFITNGIGVIGNKMAEASAEDKNAACDALLGLLGNSIAATASLSINPEGSGIVEDGKENEVPDSVLMTEEEKQAQAEKARKAQKLTKEFKQAMNTIMDTYANSMVYGQSDKIVNSAKCDISVSKAFTRKLVNKKMAISPGVGIIFPPNPKTLVGYGNETSYTVESKVNNLRANPHSNVNQTISMKSNVLDLTTFNETGMPIVAQDLDTDFEITLKMQDTKPSFKVNQTTAAEEKFIRHTFVVQANHSVVLTVLPDEEVNRDECLKDWEEPLFGDEYITMYRVYIRLGSEPLKIDSYDSNCTLPLTNNERWESVKDLKSSMVDYVPPTKATTAAVEAEVTTVALQDIDECLSSPCQNGGNCTDLVNGYTCTCTKQWLGDHCQTYNHCPLDWHVVGDHCVYLSDNDTSVEQTVETTTIFGNSTHNTTQNTTNVENGAASLCSSVSAQHYVPADEQELNDLMKKLPNGTAYTIAAKWDSNISSYVWMDSNQPTFFNSSWLSNSNANLTEQECVKVTNKGLVAIDCSEVEKVACYTVINECSTAPCQNGGTCHDQVGKVKCTCHSGYTGSKCQKANYCLTDWHPYSSGCLYIDTTPRTRSNASDTCSLNHGGILLFFSSWEEVYKFQERFNLGNTASNNSKYYIDAEREYVTSDNDTIPVWKWSSTGTTAFFNDTEIGAPATGLDCAYIEESSSSHGLGGANCTTELLGSICYKNQPEVNECETNPCKNGGVCVDGDGFFTCNCTTGYEGTECETSVDGDNVGEDIPVWKRKKMPDKWSCFLEHEKYRFNQTTKVTYGVKSIRVKRSEWLNASSAAEVWDMAIAAMNDADQTWVLEWTAANYSHFTSIASCLWWYEDDFGNERWETSGMKVLPFSDWQYAICSTNHLTEFGSSFVVPMNSIDLENSAFTKLDENPLVFAVMVCIMCLYLVLVVWARKADKEDELKAGTTPLIDNDPRDKYLYELTVFTGAKPNGGTTAKVRFIITGDDGDTGPRLLWDDKRQVLQRGATDAFVMACRKPLGTLNHIRVWHDNTGKNPSWFFSRMMVHDLQTEHKYFFICDRWLAVEHDDGMLDRMVPVAGIAELTSFNHLFWTKTRKNLTDGHIWFSVFQRPPSSRFTRVQRLTCCLALLFSSMLASILFYRTESTAPAVLFRIGPISFTPQQIYVGFISGLIAFPANLIIVTIFRFSKERKKKTIPMVTANEEDFKKWRIQEEDDLAGELERQKEFLETGDHDKRLLKSARGTRSRVDYGGISYIDNVGGTPQVNQTKDDPNKKKKKKGFGLPWWFIFIGYGLSLGVVGVAFWATVEVAGVFGPQKAQEWLISFCISIVESVFLSQPIKVLVMALFFALVWKKPDTSEEDERASHLKPNEDWMHKHMTEQDMEDPEKRKEIDKYKDGPLEMDPEIIRTAREERFKEMQMHAIIRECILYFLWLYILMMVGYGNRDPWSYTMNSNFKNMFIHGSYSQHDDPLDTYNFKKVYSRPHFWKYMENVALPTLYTPGWYGGNLSSWQDSLIGDGSAYLVGQVRLRSLRVKPETCLMPVYKYVPECRPSYSYFSEDETSYKKGWVPVNTTDDADDAWKYRTWNELDGYPHWGVLGTYSGGGYVADLGLDLDTAKKVIAELVEHRWLDELTRIIFIEFLTYNPNINLFAASMSTIEFAETGAGQATPKFHIMRLDRYFGPFMFVVMGAEVLTCCFLLYFIIKEGQKIFKERKAYFKSTWNCIEVFVLSSSVVAIVMFCYRLLVANIISGEIHADPWKFHNFQYVVMWDDIYASFLGIIITFATIKFLKLLRFNKRMGMLTATLKYAWPNLWQFLVMFAIMFFAFAQVSYCMFHTALYDFQSFIKSSETLFSVMLGKFDFYQLASADAIWGPVVLLNFCLFVSFILVNFFVTIVIDAYEHVRLDLSKQSNDHEIVDFIMDRFKIATGMKKPERKVANRLAEKSHKKELEPEEYVEGADPNAPNAFYLRERVENMMSKLETYINFKSDDKELMNELDNLSAPNRKKKIFSS